MLAVFAFLCLSVLTIVNGQNVNANVNAKVNAGGPAGPTTTTTKATKPPHTKPPPKTKKPKPPPKNGKAANTTAAPKTTKPTPHGNTTKAPPTTTTKPGPTTKEPKPGKYNCRVCQGVGPDCTGDTYDKDVDFCLKMQGTVSDPSKVPPFFAQMYTLLFGKDVKKMMAEHQGQNVTIRKGVPLSMLALLGQKVKEPGCSDYKNLIGLDNCEACLCEGDCH